MVSVWPIPAVSAVTTPVAEIEATELLLLSHVPPGVPSVNWVGAPEHITVIPLIATGFAFTVTGHVAAAQPGTV